MYEEEHLITVHCPMEISDTHGGDNGFQSLNFRLIRVLFGCVYRLVSVDNTVIKLVSRATSEMI